MVLCLVPAEIPRPAPGLQRAERPDREGENRRGEVLHMVGLNIFSLSFLPKLQPCAKSELQQVPLQNPVTAHGHVRRSLFQLDCRASWPAHCKPQLNEMSFFVGIPW